MEEKESNATPRPADTSQVSKNRLVIRVVIPQAPPPQDPNASRLNTRAISVALVVLAAVALAWLGFNLFRSDPPDARVPSQATAKLDARSQIPASNSGQAAPAAADEAPSEIGQTSADAAPAEDASNMGGATNATTVSSSAQQQADIATSPINQVIPDVPRSALQTIRGTIRVTMQVNIGKEGTVLAVTPKVPGPSRYFERLSLEAARKWTFTPSTSDKERTMLIQFHYTREGATAHTNMPEQH